MSLRKELTLACHKVYDKGFVAAYDGNLSCRIDEERILITPTRKSKGQIEEEDLLEIDLTGRIISGVGKASTENKIHTFIYNNRPEVKSVIHCHPIYATALATSFIGMNEPILPEVILGIGKIPLCKYATPSTDQMPESLKAHIEYAWAFLLMNHGAVTLGTSVEEAYFNMEKLEHAAQITYLCKTLGRPSILSRRNLDELYKVAEDTYGLKLDNKSKY
ncbi:MAG: class II aldolase/adducin family protein [Bacteroidetes bacterium]|nr:class II aldolase/adducin family protein [Bacteroidota bacterium]MBU1678577.1 class II aldolase/adducin family protein [Bacteroidota bacterium]MBU2505173.1 class II aldolase/adducin family protein [Bacteroidota bacterium]